MQHSLFDTPKKREIYLQGGYLYYWSNFLDHDTALYLFEELEQQLPWEQPSIKIAGKRIAIPRKQVWMGDNKTSYVYSGQRFEPLPWHPDLWQLKQTIQQVSGESFNSVLCNLYRDGQDSVAWHADDEPELGEAPVIASYSLGAPRKFQMRLKGESKT
ncbi:MAG: alpha-ketoglutarate-dependent dioxygenase AlkB, partial [Oleiphilaceae bacterium]|nr:alpha-ketoglutarate-dependent dioxygenase AlkB [Oleiphilaceae bacterium]